MRPLLIALLFSVSPVWAAAPKPEAFLPVFELAGIGLLCEQAATLARHELNDQQQAQVVQVLEPQALCLDLAGRLAGRIDQAQLQEAEQLLTGELAKSFAAAERAVGKDLDGLTEYRQVLVEKPPRAERVALVQGLDKVARTTDLATVLRYETGKTRTYMMSRAQGAPIDEKTLSERTQAQQEALRSSSAQSVESFMLFAYRHKPSEQVGRYAELYQQPAVAAILGGTIEFLPQIFAERRAKL